MRRLILLVLLAAVRHLVAADRDSELKQEIPKLQSDYRVSLTTPLGPETLLCRIYYDRFN